MPEHDRRLRIADDSGQALDAARRAGVNARNGDQPRADATEEAGDVVEAVLEEQDDAVAGRGEARQGAADRMGRFFQPARVEGTLAGFAVRAPLARVPENLMKWIVAIVLLAFGTLWIGEGGENFSGGQGRRLALARTLLSAAPILVLDEPCAGLDAATEMEFFKILNEAAQGRSLLLIAHRLTGAEQLDRIWRLTGGALVAATA